MPTCLTFAANFAYSHRTSASSGVRLGWPVYGLLRKTGSEVEEGAGGGVTLIAMMAIANKAADHVPGRCPSQQIPGHWHDFLTPSF